MGRPAARVSDRWCGGLGLWRKAACTRGIRMHIADQSAAPDERVGLCTCPEHAAYTWTGHVYVRLCRMCVLSEACSMHMAYVHAHSHTSLRASRDRRCPLAPVCAWTDTGVTGRVLSCSPHGSRTGSAHRSPRRRKTSDDRALFLRVRTPEPISGGAEGRAGIECALSPAHAPRTRT